jgi:hypothetical protein
VQRRMPGSHLGCRSQPAWCATMSARPQTAPAHPQQAPLIP